MNCTRNCLYQRNGECSLKLTSSDATNRCPLMPEDSPADAPFKYRPTNADHIRSMTDEELADFMSAFCEMSDDCKRCPLFGGCPESDRACWWEEWLKQPYKGDNDA